MACGASRTRLGRGETISAWDRKKASIIPALKAGLSDDDQAVREESAMALFAFGERVPVVIELIEQAARDPDRTKESNLVSTLKAWRAEQERKKPIEPAVPGDGAPGSGLGRRLPD